MLELVSVHIPKTGGTSLLNILRRKYGWRLQLIYPAPIFPWTRKIRAKFRIGIQNIPASVAPRAVHGHFPASKFVNSGAEMITFLRDPLEQRVSAYYYHRRRHENRGMIANDEAELAVGTSLEEFVSASKPIFSRFIDVEINRFSFIGLMSEYESDVKRLCKYLKIDYAPVHVNRNPSRSPYKIDSGIWKIYEKSNPIDVERFEIALDYRKRLLRS